MAHSPSLLPLKVLVICLGLALAGGMIFVLAAIAQESGPAAQAHCPDAYFHQPGGTTLTSVMPQGGNVQLTLLQAGQAKVLTVERCTGKLLQTLTIGP